METISLQTLSPQETEQVSGGWIPAAIGALAGSYLYDEMGGYEGINRSISNAVGLLAMRIIPLPPLFRRN